jgi:hypothetical protein
MKTFKNEKMVLTYVFDGIACYTITRNILGKYTLYKIIDDDYQKMKIAESPIEFDKLVEKDRGK